MKSAKCQACGFVGWSDAEHCKACGTPFNRSASYAAPANAAYESWEQASGQSKGLAILSLVLGIISFITFGLIGIGAVAGIVLGVVAMNRAKREPWKYGGRGMAVAGLVLSISSLAVGVPIGLIAAISIPNLMAARMAANEGSAIYNLKIISAAELTYEKQYGKYATLEELAEVGLVDAKLASGVKNGYRFTVELASDADAPPFSADCVPLEYRQSGRRSFHVDNTLVVRAADNQGGPATAVDLPLGEDSMPPLAQPRRVRSDY